MDKLYGFIFLFTTKLDVLQALTLSHVVVPKMVHSLITNKVVTKSVERY